MPELPEVETTVRGLNQKVLNRAFLDLWTDAEKLFRKPESPKKFKNLLINRKIVRVWRRAKNIIFELSDGHSLLIHQKMTGHLLIGNWKLKNKKWEPTINGLLNDRNNGYIHIIFWLSGNLMMALSDLRKFAKVELWETNELLENLRRLGPEPLDINFTFNKFRGILKNKKGKIKQVLMKQEIISGIGNIYSDEALWQARVHPLKDVSKLDRAELKNIFEAIKNVLQKGVKLGGDSFSDYRKPDGSRGNFDGERNAYRRSGEKCLRCKKAIIKRIKIGGRSSCFCPNCQKV